MNILPIILALGFLQGKLAGELTFLAAGIA
jgi:hypothetical protein